MPSFVGFSTISKVLPKILSGLNVWNDEKKQILQAKHNEQRAAIEAGFSPQPFIISTPTTNDASDNIFEEEKKGPPPRAAAANPTPAPARRAAPARQAAAAAQQAVEEEKKEPVAQARPAGPTRTNTIPNGSLILGWSEGSKYRNTLFTYHPTTEAFAPMVENDVTCEGQGILQLGMDLFTLTNGFPA